MSLYHGLFFAIGTIFSSLCCIYIFNQKLKEKDQKLEEKNNQISSLEQQNTHFVINNKTLEKELELSKNNIQFYQTQITELEKRMSVQFENLSNKILESSMAKMEESSTKNLNQMLSPLKDKLTQFQTKVEFLYGEEAKERHSLKNEIKNISEIGQQLNQDAINLTKALKGDVKAQGNWGEVVLERILENSGLRKGEEYLPQGIGLNLKNEDGNIQRPDVIVMLPDNKNIIIDSKVSLLHYEGYISSENQNEKANFLKLFNDSIVAHVKGLAEKGYQLNDKLQSPDFVLLFFPIEGAYSLAIQENPDLFYWAWEKSIIIVGPTTLMATLKTVSSIWRQEKSNKNAMAIASESGKLYDKMANFLSDLHKIGDQIKKADEAYQQSIGKLKTGKGNVLNRLELIKQLGAKTKKQIEMSPDTEILELDSTNQ